MKANFFQLITGAAIVGTLGSGVFTPVHAFQVWSLNFTPEGGGGRTGTGTGSMTYDDGFNTLRLQATFSGLSGNVTVAHLHGITAQPGTGTASVIVPSGSSLPNFPTGATFGTYDQTFDLGSDSTYRAAFLTANNNSPDDARDSLIASFDAGTTYFNIHSTTFTGGEIRAFATAVPEPLTILGAATAVGFGAKFKRRLAQSQKSKKDVG
ncbi:MAG: PEP-CTERM sorting domain-containing protein [Snowella sp.]|nr:PEP-CTERM sorting domain-containing protein [Snowella sp.]